MKQTAVEWLENELRKRIPQFYAHYVMDMDSVYEQAKEMEKQQIKKAHYDGALFFQESKELIGQEVPYIDDANNYYNETYKSKN